MSLVALLLVGCAAGPRLADYPERIIDRPYTLPKGVASWSSPTTGGVGFSSEDVDAILPIPYPLVWQLAVSDDVNLIFAPIPLAAAWQITNGDRVRLGALFVAGLGYNSDRGFLLVPDVELSLRLELARDSALDLTVEGALQIAAELPHVDAGSVSGTIGPLLQLEDHLAVRPRLSLRYDRGRRSSDLVAGEVGDTRSDDLQLGVGFGGTVVLHRQWDLAWSLDVYRRESSHTTAVVAYVNPIHYW